jgi:hypothetical protein
MGGNPRDAGHLTREASVVEAGQDGWFAGPPGPSGTVEEAARVAARLATPSESATRAGLPLRRSKAHLVPGAYEDGNPPDVPRRSADEVRSRLSGYQSGVRKAREK